ncbi:type VI secretion system lipoprotein TssJ [Herbaspirillum lusitanum]|uniref:Type VI secretion system lipoprotein TssJ n=1 Tax=Herbaspirillum lusitanum TaxID=213312 RepID=A0ABW9AFJ2_9BURK
MHFKFIAAVCAASLLSGCGAWQAVSDTTVSVARSVFTKQVKVLNIDFKAREQLNPDDNQKSLSVVVRVYQLKDHKTFDSASYRDLLRNDKSILAGDLLDSRGLMLLPGTTASLSQPMQEGTRFIGVAVFFRKTALDTHWRRVLPKKMLSADEPLRLELLDSELIVAGDPLSERPAR